MSKYFRPKALRPGDKVGVIAPSFPSAVWFPRRLDASLDGLRRHLGVEPVIAPHVREATGFRSGDARTRATEFQAFLEDPEIAAIFTTLGGFNSNELLSHIDFNRIGDQPKIVIGYSDVTALLIALTSVKGWITFYGPALMSQIGEYPGPQPFTLAQMLRVLCEDCSGLVLPDATERTNQFLDWGKDEAYQRARDMQPNPGREVWRPGAAQGVLFGGNLETLNFLVGTPWLAVPDDTILYIEATEAEAHPARVHRALTHFRQCGLLDRVRGVLVGHSPDAKPIAGESLRTVVCDALDGLNGPIVGELSFGHVDPMLTLPNGCRINVDANDEGAQLTLIESAVSLI